MNDRNNLFNNSWLPRYRQIAYHILCWVLYISYELFFAIFFFHLSTSVKDFIFFYTCNIGLFYVNYFLLSKFINRPQPKYLLLIIGVLLELTVFLVIKVIWEYFAFVSGIFSNRPSDQLWRAIIMDLYRNLNFLFISAVTWSLINFGRFQQRITNLSLKRALAENAHKELQYQFSRAQNAFLKQQINPHLLFNSLNAIYNTVYQNSPKESKSVLLLSEIMRYSFEEPELDGWVSLSSELAQLRNLIELNSYRFDYPLLISFKIHGDSTKYKIIPLILITLTENMFKHGDLRFSPRSIDIEIDNVGRMIFTTKNVPKRIKHPDQNTHVGLSNTRLRLDYAYPGKYTLNLTETDELFQLELTINLKS